MAIFNIYKNATKIGENSEFFIFFYSDAASGRYIFCYKAQMAISGIVNALDLLALLDKEIFKVPQVF